MRLSDLDSRRRRLQAELATQTNHSSFQPDTNPPLDSPTEAVQETQSRHDSGAEEDAGFNWIDDALHFGRAWQRYRYCYRAASHIKVLDAGCGTGQSSAWIMAMNPGSEVLGLDLSATSIALATRSIVPPAGSKVAFQVADLNKPIAGFAGSSPQLFDFVVCRRVLGESTNPTQILKNLSEVMKPDGLLFVSLPSRRGREAARMLRRAVDALATPGMTLAERSRIALEIYKGLLPDHPLRLEIAEKVGSEPETFLVDYLTETRDWSLEEAIAMLDQAGLQLLHAANPANWHPDRIFTETALEDSLSYRIERLDPQRLSRLVDALDPSATSQDHHLYACHKAFKPLIPEWTNSGKPQKSSEAFDRLIPHPTGIARPFENDGRTFASGRVLYQTVSGGVGELDRLTNLMLLSSDGTRTVGAINNDLASRTRASDDAQARQDCWINLADSGLILLQPPDAFDEGES